MNKTLTDQASRKGQAKLKKKSAVRFVRAPDPDYGKANSIFSINLEPGETVRWIWSSDCSGSFVSGYEILPVKLYDDESALNKKAKANPKVASKS